jgi:hypothetical protein
LDIPAIHRKGQVQLTSDKTNQATQGDLDKPAFLRHGGRRHWEEYPQTAERPGGPGDLNPDELDYLRNVDVPATVRQKFAQSRGHKWPMDEDSEWVNTITGQAASPKDAEWANKFAQDSQARIQAHKQVSQPGSVQPAPTGDPQRTRTRAQSAFDELGDSVKESDKENEREHGYSTSGLDQTGFFGQSGSSRKVAPSRSHSLDDHEPGNRRPQAVHRGQIVPRGRPRFVGESRANLKRILDETNMTLEEMMDCLSRDFKIFRETGHCSDLLHDCMNIHNHAKKLIDEEDEKPISRPPMPQPDTQLEAAGKSSSVTLNDVWRQVERVCANVYPDGDPIDHLIPWLQRHRVHGFDIGDTLESAAKANGYRDIYDYYHSLGSEHEVDEGNQFTGALAQARKHGEDHFTVDGHEYPVTETNTLNELAKLAGLNQPKAMEECNYTAEGEHCPVHGLEECSYGSMPGNLSETDYANENTVSESFAVGELSPMGSVNLNDSGISVSTSYSSRDNRKSVTVSADGDKADELMHLLKLSGLDCDDQAEESHLGSSLHGTVVVSKPTEISAPLEPMETMEAKEYGDTDVEPEEEEHYNTPKELYYSIKGSTLNPGDGEFGEKTQNPDRPTWKNGDNPLSRNALRESLNRLGNDYKSIKKTK